MGPRSRRTTWALVVVLGCLYALGEVLLGLSDGVVDESPVASAAFTVMAIVYLAVGGLVATRLPHNPVGWLLFGAGLFQGLTSVTYGYAALTLDVATGEGPASGLAAAWVTSWSWTLPLLGAPALLFLLFPNGRPVGPRWHGAVALVPLGLLLVLAGAGFAEGALTNSPRPAAANPLGVLPRDLADAISAAGFGIAVIALVLGGCSVAVRLRRARGVERLQLKWLVWSATPLPLYLVGGLVRLLLDGATGGLLAELGLVACLIVVPLAVGTAVLRYRLYDIDVVINRTLVYVTLTVTLAASYLASVLVLRFTLDPLTSGSDLAVAASTLAVAALFRPLRARIQSLVDRRFYRARYDAVRTLDEFATRLRDELDLESLQRDLRTVVLDTVHPVRVSLWLREGAR